MKRLLTTAATALVLSGAAYADNHGDMSGYTYNAEQDFYATDLIGMRVYRSDKEMAADTEIQADATTKWDDIGEINDLIVSQDGQVQVAIIGVGGFLGIGEKDVAIAMDDIKTLHEKGDGEGRFLVVNMTEQQLEDAPGIERNRDDKDNADTDGDVNAEMNADKDASDMSDEEMAEADTDSEAENMAENAGDEMAEAGEDAEQMAENAGEEMSEAGDEAENMAENAEQDMENTGDEAADSMQETADAETAMDRPLLTRPNVEREGYTDVTKAEELTSDALVGQAVYGTNDESVGEVGELVLTDSGEVEQAVINVGGFLGIGEKEIAVTFEELQILRGEGGDLRVYIDSTEDKLEQQPEFDG